MSKTTAKKARKGSDGKPQKYVGLWLDDADYRALEYLATRNNRSLAGEIRHRVLDAATTPNDPINQPKQRICDLGQREEEK